MQRVRNARDEPTGAAQDAGSELVDGVQLVRVRSHAIVENHAAGRERRTSAVLGRFQQPRGPRAAASQRVRGVPAGRLRTRRFRHRVQETDDRVETDHVLQERRALITEGTTRPNRARAA